MTEKERAIKTLAIFLRDRGKKAFQMGKLRYSHDDGCSEFTLESLTALLRAQLQEWKND